MTVRVAAAGPGCVLVGAEVAGIAALGLARGGPADRPAAALANRLLGNDPSATVVEATFSALTIQLDAPAVVAVTGAPAAVTVDGAPAAQCVALHLAAGSLLHVGLPSAGLRTYLAIGGGFVGLANGRPRPIVAGDHVALSGRPTTWAAPADVVGPRIPEQLITLPIVLGPRADWFDAEAITSLQGQVWTVSTTSNRIGVRLTGEPLTRSRDGELASEGVIRGSVQVPPSGQPVVCFADHPTTGGYPVIAVVLDAATDLLAQAAPGQRVSFVVRPPPWR